MLENICRNAACQQAFTIHAEDLAFYKSISPVFAGVRYDIPPPNFCPDCRLQRRLSFRNERFLSRRASDLSGKEVIANIHSDSPYKVFDQDEWWGDGWDPLVYGREFDFSKSFTEQLHALSLEVPRPSLITTNIENSTYTNYSLNMKNSYLVFGCSDGEDDLYGRFVIKSKNCVDCLSVYSCEFCYEAIASEGCYHCVSIINCRNCSNSLFLEDCIGCKNCMLCFGLRNKEYCIENIQYSREEYERRLQNLLPLTRDTLASLETQFQALAITLPHRHAFISASEGCTGDMIVGCKNCTYSFDITDSEDCRFLCFLPKGKVTYDATYCSPSGAEHCLNVCSSTGTYGCMSTFFCWYCTNAYYAMACVHSQNVFGCVGLNHKQYCILNTQYTKEEYETLVPQIITHMQSTGEWGEYLAPSLSCFPYNETVAQEEFPLTREAAQAEGWTWREHHEDPPAVQSILEPEHVPPTIDAVQDDVLQSAIRCQVSGRLFKILKQELSFYRTMQLPLPLLHPDERHLQRLRHRSKRKLWDRTCAKCGTGIQTTYSPERPEIVYCEQCYQKEVY